MVFLDRVKIETKPFLFHGKRTKAEAKEAKGKAKDTCTIKKVHFINWLIFM